MLTNSFSQSVHKINWWFHIRVGIILSGLFLSGLALGIIIMGAAFLSDTRYIAGEILWSVSIAGLVMAVIFAVSFKIER